MKRHEIFIFLCLFPEIRLHKVSPASVYLEWLNTLDTPVIKVMTRPQVPVRGRNELRNTYLESEIICKRGSCFLAE